MEKYPDPHPPAAWATMLAAENAEEQYEEDIRARFMAIRMGSRPVPISDRVQRPKVLVLFHGTGSVEKAILKEFPQAESPRWT